MSGPHDIGSFVREEYVVNFGWFLRPEMSRLREALWVCGYSESKLKYFIVSLPHDELKRGEHAHGVYRKEAIGHFFFRFFYDF